MSCLSPETCPARLNPAGTVVPTGIASRITKATKPSHHLKGITLRRVSGGREGKEAKQNVEFVVGTHLQAYKRYVPMELSFLIFLSFVSFLIFLYI